MPVIDPHPEIFEEDPLFQEFEFDSMQEAVITMPLFQTSGENEANVFFTLDGSHPTPSGYVTFDYESSVPKNPLLFHIESLSKSLLLNLSFTLSVMQPYNFRMRC